MISKTHTKYIQSLQHKKFRDLDRVFIAEGPKVVTDLLASRIFVCSSLFALKKWVDENLDLLKQYPNITIEIVEDFELAKISALSSPNQVLAIFEQVHQVGEITTKRRITLVLDTIQDPGNMGTLIRIADWFGVNHIVCSVGCADLYNPKVVQSTMGSIARVNVVYTNLANWLKQQEVKIYAASLHGTNIKSIAISGEAIIVIGNEANGISEEILSLANEKITIPKIGHAESLNAAVAAGVILSHIT